MQRNALDLSITRMLLGSSTTTILLVSRGVPMLLGGDEIRRTQRGNNNAWCQDNVLSWLDWERADHGLLAFVGEVIALRRSEPALRHDTWFEARRGRWTLRWLNPAAFANPAQGTFGNLTRNTLRNPYAQQWDIALFKNFVITERVRAQFRGEFFNMFNHPRFGGPNTDPGSSSFGRVTPSQQNMPRVIQLALKLSF